MTLFRSYLRAISIVVLTFFSWISIQPWNYAAWAQTSPKVQKTSSPSQSAAGGFEKSLREVQKLINRLDDELGSARDITPSIEALKGHR